MKNIVPFATSIFTLFLIVTVGTQCFAQENWAAKVDKSKQERIIITTDLEIDDMNGLILSLMYADQYDLAGIVWILGHVPF
ncbi:DUF1593 domain-containing protein [Maribacter litopenaei]|uniref:DUF1593 domain-containing protein n=1 Tax=Maribacter litopenaei TaxID=2976127 RepID=A0ABY5Y6U5_9FLAO|nr:DUF1593 domain-containing protein [Maribacter litopenaei]UWX54588.1 DUF1593 domain-containing protein [Maribacter litopenaei]